MTTFSIVIPTYNRADLLPKTLDTVLAQKYQNYEVIIVDNCSTDNTEEVIISYLKDPRFRFIKHSENFERSRSRNTGMENANGKFVTFLDSDDYMYPNNLSDAAKFIEENPTIDFFQNKYELVTPERSLIYAFSFPSLKDRFRAIAIGNFISCIGIFISKEIYSKFRFNTDLAFAGIEDYEFWIRVVAEYPLYRIDKVNSGIVQHSNRTIRNLDVKALQERKQSLFKKIDSTPRLATVYKPYRELMESSSYIHIATMANSFSQHSDALRYLLLAAKKYWPLIFSYRFLRSFQISIVQKYLRGIS